MQVVILCGGKGTRLREETQYIPKPLVPIGGMPILWHIMKTYSSHGHKDFILCLGYKGLKIKTWFKNFRWLVSDVSINLGDPNSVEYHTNSTTNFKDESQWNITLVDTGLETMTGCRIKRIQKYIKDEQFLITYGDGVGDIDITASIDSHNRSNNVLTLTGVRPRGRFGEIKVVDGKVSSFFEKPQTSKGLINGGYFVADQKLFDYLIDEPTLIFEREPMDELSKNGLLGCYKHSGFWQPMDTFQEYLALNSLWDSNAAPWKTWQY